MSMPAASLCEQTCQFEKWWLSENFVGSHRWKADACSTFAQGQCYARCLENEVQWLVYLAEFLNVNSFSFILTMCLLDIHRTNWNCAFHWAIWIGTLCLCSRHKGCAVWDMPCQVTTSESQSDGGPLMYGHNWWLNVSCNWEAKQPNSLAAAIGERGPQKFTLSRWNLASFCIPPASYQ